MSEPAAAPEDVAPHDAVPLVTVIGIGNPYRRDDGAGAAVLARLATRFGRDPRVRLAELDGEQVRLVQTWEGSAAVWIVDAVRSGRPAGSIHEIDAERLTDLDDRGARLGGGHLLGLGDAVHLASALDRMPAALLVVGIEAETLDYGEGLSEPVGRAVEEAAARLCTAIDEVLSLGGTPGGRASRSLAAVRPSEGR